MVYAPREEHELELVERLARAFPVRQRRGHSRHYRIRGPGFPIPWPWSKRARFVERAPSGRTR
jgi:hypothetical protein